ncbi:MAG: hypothetical protein KDD51_15720 [Bdellovibrionales bacterium]|nr:hypothetical protein [Bdellovibrionales bacterium]
MEKLALFLLLLLAACSHVQPEPQGYNEGQFWQEQGRRRRVSQQFSGNLYLSYQGQGQQGAGKGQIIADIPDQTRMELRDPFGRLHYLAILNGKRFGVLYPRQKRYFQDTEAGRFYLKRMVGFDRSFPKLITLFMGAIPSELGSRFDSWQWDGRKGMYRGTLKDRELDWQIFIDPSNSTIKEIHGSSPFSSFDLEYERPERCCGGTSVNAPSSAHILLAKSVSLVEPKSGHRMGVEWRDVEWVSKKFPSRAFIFRPPPGSERLE